MSTNKTPLGLNNWNSSEKPVMAEFNSDNQIIDQQLRELSANKVNRVPPEVYTITPTTDFTVENNFVFYKEENGFVTVEGQLIKNSNIVDSDVPGYLPGAFRPDRTIYRSATYQGPSGMAAFVAITTDGKIVLRTAGNPATATRVNIYARFLAVQ